MGDPVRPIDALGAHVDQMRAELDNLNRQVLFLTLASGILALMLAAYSLGPKIWRAE